MAMRSIVQKKYCVQERAARLCRAISISALASTATVLLLGGCVTDPADDAGIAQLSAEECEGFESLLLDPTFDSFAQEGSAWRYRQHTGPSSFSLTVNDGQLDFSRTGPEPWAIYRQKITDPRLSGRLVRYSAEMKGEVSDEVTHAFGAKSGLFLRLGPRPDANMADHDPNIGKWDWQRVTVEATVPEMFDYLEAGFIYQGGEGMLSARAPRLELVECLP